MSKINPTNTAPLQPTAPDSAWYENPVVWLAAAVPVVGVAYGVSRYVRNNRPSQATAQAPRTSASPIARPAAPASQALPSLQEPEPLDIDKICRDYEQDIRSRLNNQNIEVTNITISATGEATRSSSGRISGCEYTFKADVTFSSPQGEITQSFTGPRKAKDGQLRYDPNNTGITYDFANSIGEVANVVKVLPSLTQLGFEISPSTDKPGVTVTHSALQSTHHFEEVQRITSTNFLQDSPAGSMLRLMDIQTFAFVRIDGETATLNIRLQYSRGRGVHEINFSSAAEFQAYAERVKALSDWTKANGMEVKFDELENEAGKKLGLKVKLFAGNGFPSEPILNSNEHTVNFDSLEALEAGKDALLEAQREAAKKGIARIATQRRGYTNRDTFYEGESHLSSIKNFETYFRFNTEQGTFEWIGAGPAPVDMSNPVELYTYLEKLAHNTPDYRAGRLACAQRQNNSEAALRNLKATDLQLSLEIENRKLTYVYRRATHPSNPDVFAGFELIRADNLTDLQTQLSNYDQHAWDQYNFLDQRFLGWKVDRIIAAHLNKTTRELSVANKDGLQISVQQDGTLRVEFHKNTLAFQNFGELEHFIKLYEQHNKTSHMPLESLKPADGSPITLETLKAEIARRATEQSRGDDNDEPPASGAAAASDGVQVQTSTTEGEGGAQFSSLAAASGASLLGPEFEALAKAYAREFSYQAALQSANGAPISQEMFRSVVELDAEKLGEAGSTKTSKTNIPHGSTGSMVAGGAAFGAIFGAADVALDHAGVSEGTKHGILGAAGVYFLTQAAAQAPVDLIAMFPAAIPGALAGGVAGAGFADTAAAQAVENFVGVDISTAQWSTLGAATGGGITASLGIAAARQTAVYAAAASSSLAGTVSSVATTALGALEVAGPLALAGAAGYATGTGLDYGLGYLFTRSGSLSTAIATAGDRAEDVPEGAPARYLENGWSYVPDTEG